MFLFHSILLSFAFEESLPLPPNPRCILPHVTTRGDHSHLSPAPQFSPSSSLSSLFQIVCSKHLLPHSEMPPLSLASTPGSFLYLLVFKNHSLLFLFPHFSFMHHPANMWLPPLCLTKSVLSKIGHQLLPNFLSQQPLWAVFACPASYGTTRVTSGLVTSFFRSFAEDPHIAFLWSPWPLPQGSVSCWLSASVASEIG